MFNCKRVDFPKMFIALLGLYFVLTPFGIVEISGLGSVLRLYAFFLIPFGFLVSHEIKITQICGCQFLLVVCSILSMFYSINIESTIQFILSQCMFLGMLILVSGVQCSKEDILFLKKCLVWTSRLSVLIIFFLVNILKGDYGLGDFFMKIRTILMAICFLG